MLAVDPADEGFHYSLAMELEKEAEHDRSLSGLRDLQHDTPPYVPAFRLGGSSDP